MARPNLQKRPSAWLGLTVLAITVVLGALRPAAAAGEPVPLADYWATLQTVITDLRGPDPSSETRENLAARLETISAVELTDGTIVPVDPAFIAAQLRSPEVNAADIRSLLTEMLSQKDDWPQASFTAADLSTLDAILQDPAYQWQEPGPNPFTEIFQTVLRWVLDILSRLFPSGSSTATFINISATGLLALVFAFILFYIYRNMMSGLVREAEVQAAGLEGIHLSADQALREAQELSRKGDYRNGVRYLYLSALLALEEHGLIRPDRTRTNQETLADLGSRPELAALLRSVVDIFDRVWYGYQPIDRADFDRYTKTVEELRRRRE